jgi:hypothetical protein
MALRQRDGTPPWGVHVCEVDSLGPKKPDGTALYAAWLAAAELRRQLEADPGPTAP